MKELWALPSVFSMRNPIIPLSSGLSPRNTASVWILRTVSFPRNSATISMYGTGGRKIEYYYESRNGGIKTHRRQSYEGIVNNLERRYRDTGSEFIKDKIEQYMSVVPCRQL